MTFSPIYLDYASATPLEPKVMALMKPYYNERFYNPSASYKLALEIKAAIETARSKVASLLGAKSSEIIFTAGGTEANNLAIDGVIRNFNNANMVISAIEHPSVYQPALKHQTKICPVDNQGLIKTAKLIDLIDDQTVLVSIMYVNNEIGTIQPLREIGHLIKEVRAKRLIQGNNLPIYFHSDACQAANYLDLHNASLGVDLMTINGGKIYGPKQSGALFVKSGVKLQPIINGGGQERGLRSGTENVPAIIGLSAALELVQQNKAVSSAKMAELQSYFIDQILAKFKTASLNGSRAKRLVNNVNVSFNGVDNEWLLIKLDEAGIMASAGSACSAASTEPSLTLKAIGLSDQQARSSIRFSLGNKTTKSELEKVIDTLKKLMP